MTNLLARLTSLRDKFSWAESDDYTRYRSKLKTQATSTARNKELKEQNYDRLNEITTLGKALTRYTTIGLDYDPEFHHWIQLIEPSWFDRQAVRIKLELEALALAGEPRPPKLKRIGKALVRYTTGEQASTWRSAYDPFSERLCHALRGSNLAEPSTVVDQIAQSDPIVVDNDPLPI